MKKLSVIGAGVIGLTTAILAQEKGYDVTVYTVDDPLMTTSTKAAASFKPSEVVYNNLTHELTELSWDKFQNIMASHGKTAGVWMHTHWEAFSTDKKPARYLSFMKYVDIASFPKVPGGYANGWKYKTYFVDTTMYIPWLTKQYQKKGNIQKVKTPFLSLQDLKMIPSEIIINCTGFGAKKMCNDTKLIPVKGQIAIIEKLHMDWSINADGFYIYPRSKDAVIGGTYEWNVENEAVENGAIHAIIKGNLRILPKLSGENIRRTYAGIRPYRLDTIRIEKEIVEDKLVIHNYGHGGAGITLSWGSARKALSLI